MDLFYDTVIRQFVVSAGSTMPLTRISHKRGDSEELRIRFQRNGVAAPSGITPVAYVVKANAGTGAASLALANSWDSEDGVYFAPFATVGTVLDALCGNLDSIILKGELTIMDGEVGPISSRIFEAEIENDLWRGNEASPESLDNPDDFYFNFTIPQTLTGDQKAQKRTDLGLGTASTANTGTSPGNVPVLDSSGKLVDSTLKVISVAGRAGAVTLAGSDIAQDSTHRFATDTEKAAWDGKADGTHTHPLSQITQSGATTGQIPKWNGSAWAPADDGGGAAFAVYDVTNDQRLAGHRADDVTPLVPGDLVRVHDQGNRLERYWPGGAITVVVTNDFGYATTGSYVLSLMPYRTNGRQVFEGAPEVSNIAVYYDGAKWVIDSNCSSGVVYAAPGSEANPWEADWTGGDAHVSTVLVNLDANWLVLRNTVELYVKDSSGTLSTGILVNGIELVNSATTYCGWVDPLDLRIAGGGIFSVSDQTGISTGFALDAGAYGPAIGFAGTATPGFVAWFGTGYPARINSFPLPCPPRSAVCIVC